MRIGIVGAGLIGRRRAVVATELGDVSIVADVDQLRARDCAALVNARAVAEWEEVIASDVQAVVIATPNKFAAPVAMAAAAAGKHVLCEKPLGRNVQEASQIVEAAASAGTLVKTGFNHRHHPAILRAHDWVAQGHIGAPMFARCIYGHGGRAGYDREWRADPEMSGGGELLDQGVHVLDLMRWFLGDFADVTGFTARWFWDVAPLEDNAFALLRTASGCVGSLHTSWTQWRNRFSFEVFGQEGFVAIEGLGGSYGIERLTVGTRRPEFGPPEITETEFAGSNPSWRAEWTEFRNAVAEGRAPLGDGRDGLEAHRLIDAVYRSSAEHRVVRMDEPGA